MIGKGSVLLVVGKPGHVRDALAGLLGALPGVGQVVCADSGLLALKAARTQSISAALLTSSLPDEEITELLQQMKLNWPSLPCLLLSEKIEHQREALFAGADRVFPTNSPSNDLLEAIVEILARN